MPPELSTLFFAQGGVATSAQILLHLTRRGMQRRLKNAELVKILPGIYSLGAPDALTRLRGLDCRFAVEYDGFDWHSSPEALRKDRQKRAALEEVGWRVLSIVTDDVRRHPEVMVRRIDGQLIRSAAA